MISGRVAQLVRAFASHARGHGFESPSLHHEACNQTVAGFFYYFTEIRNTIDRKAI